MRNYETVKRHFEALNRYRIKMYKIIFYSFGVFAALVLTAIIYFDPNVELNYTIGSLYLIVLIFLFLGWYMPKYIIKNSELRLINMQIGKSILESQTQDTNVITDKRIEDAYKFPLTTTIITLTILYLLIGGAVVLALIDKT